MLPITRTNSSNSTEESSVRCSVIDDEQIYSPEPLLSVSISFMIFPRRRSEGWRLRAIKTCRSSAKDIDPLLSRSKRSKASRNSDKYLQLLVFSETHGFLYLSSAVWSGVSDYPGKLIRCSRQTKRQAQITTNRHEGVLNAQNGLKWDSVFLLFCVFSKEYEEKNCREKIWKKTLFDIS